MMEAWIATHNTVMRGEIEDIQHSCHEKRRGTECVYFEVKAQKYVVLLASRVNLLVQMVKKKSH